MKLTKDFTLEEFTFSETATRMGKPVEIPAKELANLKYLVKNVLQPIRTAINKPMVISSGYRPKWLNEAVGGSGTSAHMQGLAADVRVIGMSNKEFARWIRDHAVDLNIPIDQVINEGGRWVHIGTRVENPRGEYLTATFSPSGTTYKEGV